MMSSRRLAIAAAGIVAVLLAAGCAGAKTVRPGATLVRINQVGYETQGGKFAFLLTRHRVGQMRFVVRRGDGGVVFAATARNSCGSWNARWRGCLVADFSALRLPGNYRLGTGSSLSPSFVIDSGAALYGAPAGRAVDFLEAQRDGPAVIAGPLGRQPAHLSDAAAPLYAAPSYRRGVLHGPLRPAGGTVDLSGGWFDAGDYLKFSGTASFADVMLLFTLRNYGASLPSAGAVAAEARFGTDWLLRTWDRRRKVLYEQVGLGDGNGGSVLGDHDLWRLPQRDDGYRARSMRFIAHRPVFAANAPGAPISPNLAGREAAAFALCAQVFRVSDPAYARRCLIAGESLFDAAATRWRGPLRASVPSSYYAEPEWRDDMELAAIELYIASRSFHGPDLPNQDTYVFLDRASYWADRYMSARGAGKDALNLYDVSPLAHYDLYRVMLATGHTTDLYTNASDVLGDLRDQLNLGRRLSRSGPLGLADPATPDDTVTHALGYAAEAGLYDAIAGRGQYAPFAQQQLSWVLGANPWGSSFVVGAGSVFPRCLAHQVANLSGSLTGTGPLLQGAVVDGPTGASDIGPVGAPDGYRRCSVRAFASFDGHGFRYLDDVRSPNTSEPSDDTAALSLLAFAQQTADLARPGPLPLP